jgi:hypothetical protein
MRRHGRKYILTWISEVLPEIEEGEFFYSVWGEAEPHLLLATAGLYVKTSVLWRCQRSSV